MYLFQQYHNLLLIIIFTAIEYKNFPSYTSLRMKSLAEKHKLARSLVSNSCQVKAIITNAPLVFFFQFNISGANNQTQTIMNNQKETHNALSIITRISYYNEQKEPIQPRAQRTQKTKLIKLTQLIFFKSNFSLRVTDIIIQFLWTQQTHDE